MTNTAEAARARIALANKLVDHEIKTGARGCVNVTEYEHVRARVLLDETATEAVFEGERGIASSNAWAFMRWADAQGWKTGFPSLQAPFTVRFTRPEGYQHPALA